MNIEDVLVRGLRDEAMRTDVDVHRLHAATRGRIQQRQPRRGWVLPLLAVAVVVLLVVVGLGAWRLTSHRSVGPTTSESSGGGGVVSAFACPDRVTVDAGARQNDDSFVPSLRDGPAAAAQSVQAIRYTFEPSQGTATLRLGNADGSLASVATFRRSGSTWVLTRTTKCSGKGGQILVPTSDPLRLGEHDATPYIPRTVGGDMVTSALVDDRSYYDAAGLVRHRTVYLTPCRRSLCLQAGRTGSFLQTDPLPRDPTPYDASSTFLPPDDAVGRPNPYRFWVVNDPTKQVDAVEARLTSGSVAGRVLRSPTWTGQAWVLLAPRDQVVSLRVHGADGWVDEPVG